jgi:hypothetical protein
MAVGTCLNPSLLGETLARSKVSEGLALILLIVEAKQRKFYKLEIILYRKVFLYK